MIVNQLISISLVLMAFGPAPADAAAIDPEPDVITDWVSLGGLEELSSAGGHYSTIPSLGNFQEEHNSTNLDRRSYCGNIPRGADCCISGYLADVAKSFPLALWADNHEPALLTARRTILRSGVRSPHQHAIPRQPRRPSAGQWLTSTGTGARSPPPELNAAQGPCMCAGMGGVSIPRANAALVSASYPLGTGGLRLTSRGEHLQSGVGGGAFRPGGLAPGIARVRGLGRRVWPKATSDGTQMGLQSLQE